nr:MAG TPA: NTP-PPase-like protein [Caudoviricetes sp.]
MTYRLYNADVLNRYAKDCHQRAVAKGFWAEKRTVYHHLMLVISEFSEAVEADRLGKWAKLDHDTIDTLQRIEGAPYAQEFLRLVKDTVEDEIADAVIRLLDLLGCLLKGVDLTQEELNMVPAAYDSDTPPNMLTDALFVVISGSVYAISRDKEFISVLSPIKSLENLCDRLGIDLMAHIELKLKYNATRPAKHGKKY